MAVSDCAGVTYSSDVSPERPTLQFGAFTIRPESGELWKDGRRVRLAPQLFQVLALIVLGRGELVTREQVRASVWADGTTVEFDQGLNYCLRQIRMTLGDNAREPVWIETVPKRGYRLLVPVTIRSETISSANQPDARDASAAAKRPVPAALRPRWRGLAPLAVVAAAALVATVWWWSGRPGAEPPTTSAVAERLFVEAEHLAGSWEPAKVADASARYRRAIEIEPGFARAWAGLANADVMLSFFEADPARAIADSDAHARRALELDATLATAHAALGHSYWHQWRWQEAGEALRRSVEANDRSAMAHQLSGLFLASIGRAKEARGHAERAVALQPISGLLNYSLAQVYLQTGDFETAVRQAERTLTLDRHYPHVFATLVRSHLQLGRYAAAAEAIDAARRVGPGDEIDVWQAYLLARTGRGDQARSILSRRRTGRQRPRNSIAEAAVFAALGEPDSAFAVLDEAVAARLRGLLWVASSPELRPLYDDPRFRTIVGRVLGPQAVAGPRRDHAN